MTEEAAKLLAADWQIIDIAEPPDFEIRSDRETLGLDIREIFIDRGGAYGSPFREERTYSCKIVPAAVYLRGYPCAYLRSGASRSPDIQQLRQLGLSPTFVKAADAFVSRQSIDKYFPMDEDAVEILRAARK